MMRKSKTDESETSRLFRKEFQDSFNKFRRETELLARGNAEFNNTWFDTLMKEGMVVTVIVVGGVVAILGALAILSAVASAGIAIPVAVVGVVAGVAFYKARERVKLKRFQSAAEALDRDDIDERIQDIGLLLSQLYVMQLRSCTDEDVRLLAQSCVTALANELLMNKHANFNHFLEASTLQAVLMKSLSAVPKIPLATTGLNSKKFNARGVMGHTAYYCKETDEYYQHVHSKSTKYGVLFFESHADLKDYESILTRTMRGGEKWRFRKMPPQEVHALMNSSIFKTYQNDKKFADRKTVALVEDDGMRNN
jgi:hypothetical protein